MAEYPLRLTVGTAPYQTRYVLQKDLLLLRFGKKVADREIDRFIGARRFTELKVKGAPDRFRMLRAVKQRLIRLPETPESPAAHAKMLVKEHRQLAAAQPVFYAEGQGPGSAAVPLFDSVAVLLRNEKDRKTLKRLAELGFERHPQMSKALAPFHYFRLKMSGQRKELGLEDEFALLEHVAGWPEVENAEFDWVKLEAYQLIPNDTHWADQWNMLRIGLVDGWDVQTGDPGVVVAIIDSGFDLAHPDLQFSPAADHFNAEQFIDGDAPPYDASPSGVGHGTCVAGLAAATLDNNAGVAGVAGGCTIMPVRLGTVPSSDRVAAGLDWARTHGARVASMSLSCVNTATAIAAVNNAWAAGLVLCAATGNGDFGSVNFPANHASVLAVGASDQMDERKRAASADGQGWWGSQWGPELDVMAPGVLVWSTDEQGLNGYNDNNGGAVNIGGINYPSTGDANGDYYALFGGTSAATPQVAGLAALLLSEYPALTNQQVRDIIMRTCDKVSAGMYPYAHDPSRPNGTWHTEMGHGRINCNAALRCADLVISDHAADTGDVPSCELVGGSWTPDAFWRYQPYVTATDNPAAMPADHEPAEPGHDNYVHAYVTNRGPGPATNILITWHIMDYPGTELVWPTDWNPGNEIAQTVIPSLAAGDSVAVQQVWPQASVDAAAGFAHPCMVVQAVCDQDRGGDIGAHVWQYNNIAQHNISYGTYDSWGSAEARTFTLPFAVGSRVGRPRWIQLLIDLRRAKDARVLLDALPDPKLPFVERILETARKNQVLVREKGNLAAGCTGTFVQDTGLMLDCCGCRALVRFKAGSSIQMPCAGDSRIPGIGDLEVTGAERVTQGGKELLRLHGSPAKVGFPLAAGQVMPLALTVMAPKGAEPGTLYRVDVTQLSDGVPTGGVSLDLEAR